MAPGTAIQGLEELFRAYGRLFRTVADLIPGESASRALDDATDALRRALEVPTDRMVEAGPAADPALESAAAAVPSAAPGTDYEVSSTTVEFDAVEARPVSSDEAPPFSYTIPRPGESGRKGTIFASHEDEIAADQELCWDVAADVVGAVEWTPLLLEAEVAPENTTDPPSVFDTVADAKVRRTKSKLRFEYDRPRGMRWEQLSGDQKLLIGAWEFEPLANGRVRAVYLVETDLGRVLSMAIRGPVRDRVTEMLTRGSVEGLKQTVE